jgi:hypothetical protein
MTTIVIAVGVALTIASGLVDEARITPVGLRQPPHARTSKLSSDWPVLSASSGGPVGVTLIALRGGFIPFFA